ncbi:MAG: CDP-alcohol phosphatidyltransferase family protein [Alphaproteobacteria bacterium]
MPATRDVLYGRHTAWRPVLIDWPTPVAIAATGSVLAVAVAAIVRVFPFGPTMAVVALGAYAGLAGVVLVAFEVTGTPRRFGLANAITLIRGALNALLLGLLAQPVALHAAWSDAAGWLFVAVALLSLALDGIDGWVARRWRLASAFGARFDVETDALLVAVLALAAVVLDQVGLWIFALALGYYAFVAARRVWPWLAAPLPPSRRRKTVFVAQAASLVLIVAPPVPPSVATALAAATLASLALSFGCDIRWLRRRREARGSCATAG